MGITMESHTLKNYVFFVPGKNQTKLKKQLDYYDQASFEDDYLHMEDIHESGGNQLSEESALKAGDVLISNSTYQATIVGRGNAGKVPTLNFSKVEFHSKGLDKYYFVYLFNCYPEILRQKERELQGNGVIRRISTKSLGKFMIPIVALEEQEKIGKIYMEILNAQAKLRKESNLLEQFTNQIIEGRLRGKESNE